MIIGIGTDLVDIRRIQRALDRFPGRFATKIFTPAEQAYADTQRLPAATYAKRFAGKEAFIKAIGEAATFREVEILNDLKGKPFIRLAESLFTSLAHRYGEFRIDITLADEYPYAMAYVVISRLLH